MINTRSGGKHDVVVTHFEEGRSFELESTAMPGTKMGIRATIEPTANGARITQAYEAEAQADSLVERARELQAEQARLPESSQVEATYSAALVVQVEAKHDQAERIQQSWGSVTAAVDAIRARYGGSSVGPASLVGPEGLRVRRRRL